MPRGRRRRVSKDAPEAARARRLLEYPCWSSGFWGPMSLFSEKRVGENDHPAHDCDDSDFGWFSCCGHLFVDRPEIRIGAHGDEGGHEQGVAQFGSSAADETLAAPLTALAGHGRQAREARGAFVFDMPEL